VSLFLATFLSLYGAMHLYLFLKVRAAFQPGGVPLILLALWMLLMTAAPLLVHAAERRDSESAALFFAWSGYTWMGLLFLFTVSSVAVDLLRLALFFCGKSYPSLGALSLSPAGSFSLPAALAVACAGWGLHEARTVKTEHVVVETEKLPPGRERLRIVQVSDVHIGLMLREGRLRKIIDTLREAEPDIVVSTGDLVDGEPGDEIPLVKLFTGIAPPLGKFAVTGNHEFYAGVRRSVSFMERSGFRVLREETAETGAVLLAGVDDPAGNYSGERAAASESPLLPRAHGNHFVLLLKHRPEIADGGGFDLQLSGHVHGGQIFPFGLVTRLFYPLPTGLTRLSNGSSVYVNRGTGTWGPPIRFLVPPEVTVIDVVPARGPDRGSR
jgi:uncharacterized protein